MGSTVGATDGEIDGLASGALDEALGALAARADSTGALPTTTDWGGSESTDLVGNMPFAEKKVAAPAAAENPRMARATGRRFPTSALVSNVCP
jgi:hypothetical protein